MKEDIRSPVMTRAEAASYLRISVRTLHAMLARGELPPPIRMGRRTLFHRQQLDDWLQARIDAAPSPTCHAAGRGSRRGRPRKTPPEPLPR